MVGRGHLLVVREKLLAGVHQRLAARAPARGADLHQLALLGGWHVLIGTGHGRLGADRDLPSCCTRPVPARPNFVTDGDRARDDGVLVVG